MSGQAESKRQRQTQTTANTAERVETSSSCCPGLILQALCTPGSSYSWPGTAGPENQLPGQLYGYPTLPTGDLRAIRYSARLNPFSSQTSHPSRFQIRTYFQTHLFLELLHSVVCREHRHARTLGKGGREELTPAALCPGEQGRAQKSEQRERGFGALAGDIHSP